MACENGNVGSIQQRLRPRAGGAPRALSGLAVATFNLGTIVVLLVLFRVLASRKSVMISLLFYRSWSQGLARDLVVLVLTFAQHLSRRVRWREGSAVTSLTCKHQLWVPQALAQEFSQAQCICKFAKITQLTLIA